MLKVTKGILKKVYRARPRDCHKYDFGLMVVIGGGKFYTGSPALAAMAAFRAGVDMVQVLAPKRAADIIASFSPNLAAYPLKGDWLDKEDLPTLISIIHSASEVAKDKTALVIGGGLGRSEETKETVLECLREVNVKTVIDADGIHAVAKNPTLIRGRNFIITPHSFEFYVLTGKKVGDLPFEKKVEIVREEAKKLDCIILLKGAKNIISDGKEVAIDETGTPFMTVGGTGDTLAGICGGLLAQGVSPFLAAQAAAFLNGKAGEIAAKKYGPGLVATDLIEAIPEVIRDL